MVGERGARAEPVVGVEADPPVRGQVAEQRDALLALVADDPAAAVDLQDRRPPLAGRRRGQVHVELQRACRRRGRTRCSITTCTSRRRFIENGSTVSRHGTAGRRRRSVRGPRAPRASCAADARPWQHEHDQRRSTRRRAMAEADPARATLETHPAHMKTTPWRRPAAPGGGPASSIVIHDMKKRGQPAATRLRLGEDGGEREQSAPRPPAPRKMPGTGHRRSLASPAVGDSGHRQRAGRMHGATDRPRRHVPVPRDADAAHARGDDAWSSTRRRCRAATRSTRSRSSSARRVHLVPPFRRRLVEVPFRLHHPVWVEDPDFDLDYHVRRIGGARPRRAPRSWPRSRARSPARSSTGPGRCGRSGWSRASKHGRVGSSPRSTTAAIDGASGAELMVHLFDLEPERRRTRPPPERASPSTSRPTSSWSGYAAASRLRRNARHPPAGRPTPLQSLSRVAAGDVDPEHNVGATPLTAPRTPWNAAARRRTATWRLRPGALDDVKAVKNTSASR